MKYRKILLVLLPVFTSAAVLLMVNNSVASFAATNYLFADTFTDQTLGNWTVVDAQDAKEGPSDWIVANQRGSYVLQQKSNIHVDPIDPNFEGSYLYTGEDTWTDYHLHVDMNADDNDGIFVLFRYVDEDNYYRFIVDEDRNFRRLEKRVAGVYTTLAEDNDSGYETDRWNHIHIKAINDTIAISFQSRNIFTVRDDSLTSGKIGLGTYACRNCYFDNVIVSADELIDPYADAIVTATIKISNNSYANPTRSLGRPRIPYRDFLSVGGPTYSVVYDMGQGEEIVDGEGNDLRIYEFGNLFGGINEEHDVYVSNSPTGTWSYLGQGIAISELDLANSGLSSARYVRIEDLSSKTDGTGTPGSDIDALQALHMTQEVLIAPPMSVTVSNSGDDVRIEWSAVDSASGYNLYAYKGTEGIRAASLHSPGITGAYLINSTPIIMTEYTHNNASDNELSYAVTSIDPVGVESGFGVMEEKKTYLPLISR